MHLSPQIPSGIYKLITEIFKEVLASLLDIRPTPEKQLHFYIKKQLFVDAPYKKGNISKCNKSCKEPKHEWNKNVKLLRRNI